MRTYMLHQQDDGGDWELFVVGDYARTVNRFPSLAAASGWLTAREQERGQAPAEASGGGAARLTLHLGGRGGAPLAAKAAGSPPPAPIRAAG